MGKVKSSTSEKPADRQKPQIPSFYIAMVLVTLIISFLVGDRWWNIGVPGEWQWAFYETPPFAIWIWPVFALAAALFSLIVINERIKNNRLATAVALIAFILISLLLQATVIRISPGGPKEHLSITVSPWVGGYYIEAMTVDRKGRRALRQAGMVDPGFYEELERWGVDGTADYLAVFDQRIDEFEINDPLWGHLSDHPPAPVLSHYITRRFASSSPALTNLFWSDKAEKTLTAEITSIFSDPSARGMAGFAAATWLANFARLPREEKAAAVMSVWLFRLYAALTLLPIYFLCKEMFSRRTALMALAVTSLIPALHLFSPYPDLALPLFAATFIYSFWRAARGGNVLWGAAAGLAFFLGLQFSLSLLVVGFVVALAAVLYLIFGRNMSPQIALSLKRLAVIFSGGLIGFMIPSLALAFFLDYDVFRVWWICYKTHADFAEIFARTYWKWTLAGPLEGALFAGTPIVMLFFRRMWRDAKEKRLFKRPDALLWSIFITLFVLNISGKSLGEVGRLWMFLMPLGAAVVAAEIEEDPHPRAALACVLLLMSIQTLWFRSALNVFGTGL